MKAHNPMVMLREMAEEHFCETTRMLGRVQHRLQEARAQHRQLENYEQEYQCSLRKDMMERGLSAVDLFNYQSFIMSLNQVVKQHEQHVAGCEKAVDQAKVNWKEKKQRLNAFETLLARRERAQALIQSRQEQKLMDEFAQRAGLKRERL